MVILNANAMTVDTGRPRAEAFAGNDGRITAVGKNGEIHKFADFIAISAEAIVKRITIRQKLVLLRQ